MTAILPALFAAFGAVQQPAADTGLMQYEVEGVKVVHQRRSASSEVIAVQLYLLGGVRQVPTALSGVEPFLLQASGYGTVRYPGEEARRALARTGSAASVEASPDFTLFQFHGLKRSFDSTWAVFADRVMRPSLDSAALAIVRTRMIGRVARRRASPEDYAWILADSLAFAGHAYATDPNGTEASLKAMTAESLRKYHGEQFVTSRMILVIAGDLPRAQVEEAVRATLGTLPRGDFKWTMPDPIAPKQRTVVFAGRSARTNYIVATAFGPARTSPEYPIFARAMSLYGSYVSYYVRESAALSYSAGVAVMEGGVPHARLYVSTTNPDSVIRIVNYVQGLLASNLAIPRSRLRESAEGFTRAFIAQSETASGTASALAQAMIYDGDPTLAARRAEAMRKLTSYELRRSIGTYAKCLQFAYVGDTLRVPSEPMLGKNPKC